MRNSNASSRLPWPSVPAVAPWPCHGSQPSPSTYARYSIRTADGVGVAVGTGVFVGVTVGSLATRGKKYFRGVCASNGSAPMASSSRRVPPRSHATRKRKSLLRPRARLAPLYTRHVRAPSKRPV
jgi:hypothetical protein